MTPTSSPLGHPVDIPSVPNLRDLGGYPTADGQQVRSGLLYRSAELGRLTAGDREAFARLGIRTVFDLRTEAERSTEPDPHFSMTENIALDVLAGSSDAAPAQLLALLDDPKAAAKALGGNRALNLFSAGYREIVTLDTALQAYRDFFVALARPRHRPALFHCTTGKDRTGWAAAATLMLLGVSDELVMQDYLLSTDYLLPAFKPVLDQFRSLGEDPDLLRPVIGVQPAYLEAALDEMRGRFGTIEGYFEHGLGLGPPRQRDLREILREPAAS